MGSKRSRALGRLQIEDEFEFCGLLDWQIGDPRSTSNSVHVLGSPPKHSINAQGHRIEGHQPRPIPERQTSRPSCAAGRNRQGAADPGRKSVMSRRSKTLDL